MSDPMTRLASATGEAGTPGIAPAPGPSFGPQPGQSWLEWGLGLIAGPAASAGAAAGYQPPPAPGPKAGKAQLHALLEEPTLAQQQAAAAAAAAGHPLQAPAEAAQGVLSGATTGWVAPLTQWFSTAAIWGIFLLLGLVGLVFLLSAAGVPQAQVVTRLVRHNG